MRNEYTNLSSHLYKCINIFPHFLFPNADNSNSSSLYLGFPLCLSRRTIQIGCVWVGCVKLRITFQRICEVPNEVRNLGGARRIYRAQPQIRVFYDPSAAKRSESVAWPANDVRAESAAMCFRRHFSFVSPANRLFSCQYRFSSLYLYIIYYSL